MNLILMAKILLRERGWSLSNWCYQSYKPQETIEAVFELFEVGR